MIHILLLTTFSTILSYLILKIDNSNYHYSLKNTTGTLGYYLTPFAAKAFLTQKIWDSPVDIYMEHVALHHVDNIIYKPFIVGEDSIASHSTIINADGTHRANDGGGGGNTLAL